MSVPPTTGSPLPRRAHRFDAPPSSTDVSGAARTSPATVLGDEGEEGPPRVTLEGQDLERGAGEGEGRCPLASGHGEDHDVHAPDQGKEHHVGTFPLGMAFFGKRGARGGGEGHDTLPRMSQ